MGHRSAHGDRHKPPLLKKLRCHKELMISQESVNGSKVVRDVECNAERDGRNFGFENSFDLN
ncbi:678_t:CDS:2 [Ambispora leptoticha]|uniref:678_t:CDS:1 n=1 Tax=Ambispora leptoticha TaxID=144679 RepID=A0A9N9AR25_9GLOM|nr:678_t:CDS:2 [Ambispora leptoticha]